MASPIKVIVHKAKEGGYWAEVEGLPGCVTEAETLDELHSNLKEAIVGWLMAQLPVKAVAKPADVKKLSVASQPWSPKGTRTELVCI